MPDVENLLVFGMNALRGELRPDIEAAPCQPLLKLLLCHRSVVQGLPEVLAVQTIVIPYNNRMGRMPIKLIKPFLEGFERSVRIHSNFLAREPETGASTNNKTPARTANRAICTEFFRPKKFSSF